MTPDEAKLRLAAELMDGFAAATGLAGAAPPRRYLWTDAFAVCNFLGLSRELGDGRYLELALRLVGEVHRTLGRFHPDDPRRGWLSGLTDEEAAAHPTVGGLRIGKPLPERGDREPFDPRLEWDRDGQYFHYLTRWMHALRRVGEETGEDRYHGWALELAASAHRAFTYEAPGEAVPRMVWKMSTDLSRPLVPSMGHHDPLDALVTYLELRDAAAAATLAAVGGLESEIAVASAMCAGREWASDDSLGIGGLLGAAASLARLATRGAAEAAALLPAAARDSVASLEAYARTGAWRLPAERRLAFRELGLAIGLHAVERARDAFAGARASAAAEAILQRTPLARAIEGTWADPDARRTRAWQAHPDIDGVMLATSLAPGGYLGA